MAQFPNNYIPLEQNNVRNINKYVVKTVSPRVNYLNTFYKTFLM